MATLNDFILAVQGYMAIAHREVLYGIDARKPLLDREILQAISVKYDDAHHKVRDMLNEGISASEAPSADDKVNAIFAAWQAREPDHDPGDLSIDVQDDMDLVTVGQDGRGITGIGSSIAAALDYALEVAQGDREPPLKEVRLDPNEDTNAMNAG